MIAVALVLAVVLVLRFLFRRVVYAALLVALTLWNVGCDPVQEIRTLRKFEQPPDNSCVLSVLRASDHVERAGVSNDGGIVYADLILPQGISSPGANKGKQLLITKTLSQGGTNEFEFRVPWIGFDSGTPEYRLFVESFIKEVVTAVVEKCTATGS